MRSGTDPQEALMALVPEAYRNHPDLVKHYPEVRPWAAWQLKDELLCWCGRPELSKSQPRGRALVSQAGGHGRSTNTTAT